MPSRPIAFSRTTKVLRSDSDAGPICSDKVSFCLASSVFLSVAFCRTFVAVNDITIFFNTTCAPGGLLRPWGRDEGIASLVKSKCPSRDGGRSKKARSLIGNLTEFC